MTALGFAFTGTTGPRCRGLVVLAILAMIGHGWLPTRAMPSAEQAKVEHLLAYIGGLKDCVFIRNGREYEAAQAEAHLRMKLQKAGDRVTSAREFIDRCASSSYASGKPYLIRCGSAAPRPCREVLLEELARCEKDPAPGRASGRVPTS
jgi:hypothetical protein